MMHGSGARVLMLTDKSPWPSTTGSRVRLAELWKAFDPSSRRLLMLARPSPEESLALQKEAPGQHSVIVSDSSHDLATRIQSEARSYGSEVIWASGPWIGSLPLRPLERPLVVDAPSLNRDLIRNELAARVRRGEARRFRRLAVSLQSTPRNLRSERAAWRLADVVTPCSLEDQRRLPPWVRRSAVVPNGCTLHRPPAAESPEGRLIFVGTLHYSPNAEAARILAQRILPVIRGRRPETCLDIVGAVPSGFAKGLAGCPGVNVCGFVEDLEPLYDAASLTVIPLVRTTGSNVKVLDAIAHQVPVVATEPAVRAFPQFVAGRDLIVARGWRQCAESAIELLGDPARSYELAASGSEVVRQHYTWDESRRQLVEVIEQISAQKRSP